MPENLFFLAVIPPEPVYGAIEDLKHDMANRYASKHALKSPPHITLMPPFWFEVERISEMKAEIENLGQQFLPLTIELKDFDCFRPRVIFIDVKDPSGKLISLQAALKNMFAERFQLKPDKRSTYHPHCTIGFKDLIPKMFYKAWDYYRTRNFTASFEADKMVLLKHEEGRWIPSDLLK